MACDLGPVTVINDQFRAIAEIHKTASAPLSETQSQGRTTTGNERKANATTKHS